MPKAHLMTCSDQDSLEEFLENRYVALGPFGPPSTKRQVLGNTLQTLWDVIADLERVEIGDYCFLHTEGEMIGPFRFASRFREHPDLPEILKSENLNMNDWKEAGSDLENVEDGVSWAYWAGIERPADFRDFTAPLLQIFLEQAKGRVNSVPPRFQYGDTRKIVKPLLGYELEILCRLTGFPVGQLTDWMPDGAQPQPVGSCRQIQLDLTFQGGLKSGDGHLAYEKILEAWLMRNLAGEGDDEEQITSLIGDPDYFSNSVFTYYTNFLDALTYETPPSSDDGECTECGSSTSRCDTVNVIELKRARQTGQPDAVQQLRRYVEWARQILAPQSGVDGYLISTGYSNGYLERADIDGLILVEYGQKDGGGVRLEQVEPEG